MLCPRSALGRAVLALVVAAGGSVTPAPGREPAHRPKRPLALEDLYRLDAPHALVLSPDGRRAVYERQWVDPDTRSERHAVWLVDGKPGSARPLEKDQPDGRAPVFSPDGKWVAFQSTRARPRGWKQTPAAPAESDPATDVWLISGEGGSAVPLAGPDKPATRHALRMEACSTEVNPLSSASPSCPSSGTWGAKARRRRTKPNWSVAKLIFTPRRCG